MFRSPQFCRYAWDCRSSTLSFVFAVVLGGFSTIAGLLAEERSRAFDESRVDWQENRHLMITGLEKAENFRQSMIEGGSSEAPEVRAVGRLLEEFRKQYTKPLADRPGLERFRVTEESFVAQIKAETKLSAQKAFAPFAGRWYGLWEEMPVDHHWHSVVGETAKLQEDLAPQELKLLADQYAWIGDGFGWNFLIRPRPETKSVVLGFVYHLKPYEPRTIRNRFPLVGYLDGPGRLIWVTADSVYFEEVIAAADPEETRYAITGIRFTSEAGVIRTTGDGFQAVYGKSAENRPMFQTFPAKLESR